MVTARVWLEDNEYYLSEKTRTFWKDSGGLPKRYFVVLKVICVLLAIIFSGVILFCAEYYMLLIASFLIVHTVAVSLCNKIFLGAWR